MHGSVVNLTRIMMHIRAGELSPSPEDGGVRSFFLPWPLKGKASAQAAMFDKLGVTTLGQQKKILQL